MGLLTGLIVRTSFRLITLTTANSSNDENTKIKHIDIQTSMALIYDTRGKEDLAPELCVVIVNTGKTRKNNIIIVPRYKSQRRPTTRTLFHRCRRAKHGKIQVRLQRDSQDSIKGGSSNFF